MSLINNMLKDLEKRKTHATPIPLIRLAKENKTHIDFLVENYRLLLFAGVMILVTTSLIYYLLKPTTDTLAFVKESPTIASSPQTTDSEIAWLTPATITGATLQVKDNITELSFLLDHPVFYHINSDGMSNQFSFVIENAKLQAELPFSAYLHTAIQQITADVADGNTRFNITLYPGATIKYVDLHTDNKNPELVIAIEYHATSAKNTFAATATPTIKSPVMQSLLLQEYRRALNAAREDNYQTAIDGLSAIIKSDPSFKDARASLVALMIDQGQALKASLIINDGLRLAPNYAPFVELKARLLSQSGKVDTAIALLQSASPPLKDNPDYHALMAALYARNNQDQLAAQLYRHLLALDDHNGSWWFGLGVSLDKLNQRQSAVDAYTKAINEGHLTVDAITYLQNRLQFLQGDGNVKS